MQLDFVQQGGGLYSSVEATVCVRYSRDYRSRVFFSTMAPQSGRFHRGRMHEGEPLRKRRTGGSSRVLPHYIE